MKYLIPLILCLFSLFPSWGFAQCGCGDGDCSSSCMCGCQDPENSTPPGSTYPGKSSNVGLLARVPLSEMGGGASGVLGNDCWGWTDKLSGREFAIMGMTHAAAFVEITDPENPVYVGILPGAGTNSTWRDIKTYNDRAYIVADGSGSTNASHGVQVFNLRRLLTATLPTTFTADARYTGLGKAHNIVINEATGFAYVVGSSSQNSAGGLIILDLKNGALPTLHSVFSADGYTHDAQVVNYRGPDTDHKNKEVAFCCNEDTLTIVDVTKNGNPPSQISRTGYPSSRYSHQGWLSEDHKLFYMNDELDELQLGPFHTRTHIWNVENLDNPVYIGAHEGTESTIDHNLYVKGKYIFQAHYTAGLRILEIGKLSPTAIKEVGFFDTYGANNDTTFNGAWSVYPYFPSGTIIVSDRQGGLYVLDFQPPPSRLDTIVKKVVDWSISSLRRFVTGN